MCTIHVLKPNWLSKWTFHDVNQSEILLVLIVGQYYSQLSVKDCNYSKTCELGANIPFTMETQKCTLKDLVVRLTPCGAYYEHHYFM